MVTNKERRLRVKETLLGKRKKRNVYKLCKCGCGEKFLVQKQRKKFLDNNHRLKYYNREYKRQWVIKRILLERC